MVGAAVSNDRLGIGFSMNQKSAEMALAYLCHRLDRTVLATNVERSLN
jgi:hypothetical protein